MQARRRESAEQSFDAACSRHGSYRSLSTGGYIATGGHGGILGGMGTYGVAVLHYVPALKHTYQSEVNLSKIPSACSLPVQLETVSNSLKRKSRM